jgi:hypothetical protein
MIRIKNLIVLVAFMAVATATQVATAKPLMTASTSYCEETNPKEPRKKDSLDEWLDKLSFYESGNRQHIKVMDTNGKYSYGCLQFQEQTIRSYVQRYDLGGNWEKTEYLNIAYDCQASKEVARKMIEEDYANWKHWYNTVKRPEVGYPPKPPRQTANVLRAL